MAITLSTGTVIAIAKTYATADPVSNMSNATECVCTVLAGHGIVDGDYVEVTAGWGRLDQRIARIKSSAATTVTLEGIDTSNTTLYSGTSTGSLRVITEWENLSQLKSMSTSGGDQQYADITAIDDVVTKQAPTVRSAVSMSIEVFDDPSLAWYNTVQAASESSVPRGIKLTTPNGAKTVGNTYWSQSAVPNIAKNDAVTTKIELSYASQQTRYAS